MTPASPYRIFIVEDDPWYGEVLKYHLSMNPDYELHRFVTGEACLKHLRQSPPHLITMDYSLPDINGADLLRQIREQLPDTPVIVISGQQDVETAVGLLQAGVHDYFVKDDRTKDLLWNAILKIRENQNLKREIEQLREALGQKYDFGNLLIGNSPAIRNVFTLIQKAVRTNINVSISGETGTGKELVAKSIHYHSDRRKKPFVAVNMAAIPRELTESELFGHEKGAFTGAASRKIGRFEEANKGTLFLDEVAEMDLTLQSKLLRVLQERELVRVGGNERIQLDIRLVVASHKNLLDEVRQGRFREDLYYRLMGLPIVLPPLRDRATDVLLLARHFLDEFCKDNHLTSPAISPAATDKLLQYSFPGNVRELKAVMQMAAVMCDGQEIRPDDLMLTSGSDESVVGAEGKTLRQYTIQIIKSYLSKYDNNVVLVAEKLDVGKSTIYKMIQNNELTLA
ncbi:putative two component, sigma54 specific,transcriptional regulator, Fis family [Fibrella aestuarina BUZ 2]|uniref:Putative two component, sigma54 specific,transcriptional regulator, Fis family n=1 Tax=Fibrella aestuarina BUZ 2 TaxID=1166018 RepID=I0KF59_9BACT|nr:sigma-54 dependent transcriptional regulator [Fibrella aestuarina]CCH02762.1 putative two component, sigma54 specific,transcriptional regulator, Fis family [Fibrella aestuarina BUZ 2]